MPLILSILRGPSASERREIADGPFSVGRGPGSDWTLPDPDRVLSKRHCEFAREGGIWSVTDRSSNGTRLNGDCLPPDEPRPLGGQDRLTVGTYEIEARTTADAVRKEDDELLDAAERLTGDPFPLRDGADPLQLVRPGNGLPADFDPLLNSHAVADSPLAASDHVSDLEQNFQPPRPEQELLPPDWDRLDETSAKEPPAPSPAPVVAPMPPPAVAPPEPAEGMPSMPSALAAFAAGAGMRRAPSGDADVTLQALGAAFRAVVAGLRGMMIARATVKGEFRIQQTVIRVAGNNPLKFSADDDDALNGLLGVGRDPGMSPQRAIAEAFRDMRLHELAVAVAMQQAVHDVLAGLDPSRVMFGGLDTAPGWASEAVPETVMDKALGLRKRAAWDAYRRLHAETMRALTDDFDSVFGKSFVRAYEAALASLSERDTEEQP